MNIKLQKLTFALTLLGTQAFADVSWKIYSDDAVKTATAQGKSVLLGFHKKGCGTCETQDEALEKAGLNNLKNVEAFKVEYRDSSTAPIYQKYGLNQKQWSALVLLKNGNEVARINPGTTDEKQIAELVAKAK